MESEGNIAIDWFDAKKVIVDPGKFQSIIIDKKKQHLTKETLEIENKASFSKIVRSPNRR